MKTPSIAALAVFAALLAAGCGHDAPHGAPEGAPLRIATLSVKPAAEPAVVRGVGTLHAWREATLAGKVMGTVTEIRKQAGDPVRRGEVVVVVDSRDVAGQIAQAEGALAQARAAAVLAQANFTRFEALHRRGSASALELDQARYQRDAADGAVRQAEGALATARSYRAYAEMAAPFDGRMVDRMADIGDLASPGVPLARIEDASKLTAHVTLGAAEAAAIVPGAPATLEIPSAAGLTVEGRVSEVVTAVDAASHTVLVKVDVPAGAELRSGLYVRAAFASGVRNVLRVPRTALVTRGGLTGCFVVEEGRAAFRLVETAAGDAAQGAVAAAASAGMTASVEVISGLEAGDVVVTAPVPGLENGRRVEVAG